MYIHVYKGYSIPFRNDTYLFKNCRIMIYYIVSNNDTKYTFDYYIYFDFFLNLVYVSKNSDDYLVPKKLYEEIIWVWRRYKYMYNLYPYVPK